MAKVPMSYYAKAQNVSSVDQNWSISIFAFFGWGWQVSNYLWPSIGSLIKGPVDLGVSLVTNDQITAMMLHMAASEDLILQV